MTPVWRGDRVQRATVPVPVDHRHPRGATLDLAVVRYRADPARRHGVLVVCPDDPGSSGTALAARLADLLPRVVTERFDLVGFDHRFSGASAPLTADLTDDEVLWAFHRPESFAAEVRFQRALVDKCFPRHAAVLPHLTSRNIARDVDVVRAALGADRISLLGHNYGGYIALVYAHMFGPRTDRVVVDSVLDPDWVWRGLFRAVAAGAEAGLDRWARWCAATGRIARTPDRVRAYAERLWELGSAAIGPVPVTGALLRMITVVLLRADRTYGVLADVLAAAAGDAEPEPAAVAELGALFGTPKPRSAGVAHLAILSGECPWPRDLAVYRADLEAARGTLVGEAMAGPKPGAFWPVPPLEPATAIGGPAEVLLVQSEHDPFTPASGARHVRELLPRSRLVLAEDLAHHRVFPFSGHGGVTRAVTDYLVSGRLPDNDLSIAEATPWTSTTSS
ncbi:alpha/beta fold hydrolase [Saccharothrix obliqua]|uniref:alpha/beta fold hydrolase n=1 Tax=Saccharothrix obliqua TaxID=2861747 RepID=UPI001C5CE8B2|nr:alpha/beta fold hydrolase [Saccharothrix obliqua]MBW4721441.1 alpha/beta hydrolase [Saccharothrix obliqua]